MFKGPLPHFIFVKCLVIVHTTRNILCVLNSLKLLKYKHMWDLVLYRQAFCPNLNNILICFKKIPNILNAYK